MVQERHYLFVELAAQRCAQLMRGAKPKVEFPAHKFTTIATEEVAQDLVPWEFRDADATTKEDDGENEEDAAEEPAKSSRKEEEKE